MRNQPSLEMISSRLGEAVMEVLQQLGNPNKISIQKLIETCETDPVASACIQLKGARARQLMNGEFIHANKSIKDWADSTISEMEGSLEDLGEKLSSSLPLGFSCAEYGLLVKRKKYGLKKFHYLNPANVRFSVEMGDLKFIEYNDGGYVKKIPKEKVIHIKNQSVISFGRKSLYGSPEMARAYPFIKLKQLMYSELSIAAKRLATGILVGRTEPGETLQILDSLGNPIDNGNGQFKTISSARHLADQFSKLESNGYMVTTKNTDVSAMQVPAGEQFWSLTNNLINEQIMRCFLVPDTVWQQGVATFGVGGLSTNQMNILDSSILAVVGQIKDQLVETIFKPLIQFNFGIQKDYGKFDTTSSTDPAMVNQNTGMLMSAFQSGLIQNSDLAALNKLRENIGLPTITEEEQKFQIEAQAKLQLVAAAASRPQEIQQPMPQEEIPQDGYIPSGENMQYN